MTHLKVWLTYRSRREILTFDANKFTVKTFVEQVLLTIPPIVVISSAFCLRLKCPDYKPRRLAQLALIAQARACPVPRTTQNRRQNPIGIRDGAFGLLQARGVSALQLQEEREGCDGQAGDGVEDTTLLRPCRPRQATKIADHLRRVWEGSTCPVLVFLLFG